MDFKTKREYKRKAILYNRLAYSMIALFMMMFVLLIVLNTQHKDMSIWVNVTLIITILTAVCVGLIFTINGTVYSTKLDRYKKSIRRYRTCVLFQKSINCAIDGNINKAIEYNTLMPNGDYIDNVLYGFLVAECRHSNDEKLIEKGKKHVGILLKKYNPDNIKLD